MDAVNFQPFMDGAGEYRQGYDTKTPFVIDGWKYAMNGIRIIRVRTDEPNTTPRDGLRYPRVQTVFALIDEATDFAPWPGVAELEVCDEKCLKCFGSGHLNQVQCEACGGSGEAECEACGHLMDCGKCNGRGKAGGMPCEQCQTKGHYPHPFRLRVGGVWIRVDNDAAIRTLPNPRFTISGDYALVKFDGGEAACARLDDLNDAIRN